MANEKKYEAVGRRLRHVRLALHPEKTITDYAVFLGFSYTRYLNWESGLNRPQPDHAEVLCDKLGLNMDFIYRGIEAALPQNTLNALSSSPLDRVAKRSTDTPD